MTTSQQSPAGRHRAAVPAPPAQRSAGATSTTRIGSAAATGLRPLPRHEAEPVRPQYSRPRIDRPAGAARHTGPQGGTGPGHPRYVPAPQHDGHAAPRPGLAARQNTSPAAQQVAFARPVSSEAPTQTAVPAAPLAQAVRTGSLPPAAPAGSRPTAVPAGSHPTAVPAASLPSAAPVVLLPQAGWLPSVAPGGSLPPTTPPKPANKRRRWPFAAGRSSCC